MTQLQGKVAFITGGSKGIGFGVAQVLLQKGIHVAITSRSLESAQKAANKLSVFAADSAKVLALKADVRDYQQQQDAVKATESSLGSIDIVIANAGLGVFGSIEDITIEAWNQVIETNLTGVFYTLKSTLSSLKNTKGYYITISSLAGTNFFAGGTAYNASKFGVTGFTQAAMLDLRSHGIKVSTIMPGSVSTYFNGNEPSQKDAWKIQQEDIGEFTEKSIARRGPRGTLRETH